MIIQGFIYSNTHRCICSLVLSLVPLTNSDLKVLKKLSATALSQQFPFLLILCSSFKDFNRLTVCLQAYRMPVRMKYHSISKRSVPVGHPNGRDYSMGYIHLITYGPSDRFPIKKIQHTSQIKKSTPTWNIVQIRDIRFHRFILIKFTIQQIWNNLIVVRGIRCHFESSGKFATQAHFFHVACYSDPRDRNSGCLQILRQPRTSIAPFSREICISDLFVQLHTLTFTLTLPNL